MNLFQSSNGDAEGQNRLADSVGEGGTDQEWKHTYYHMSNSQRELPCDTRSSTQRPVTTYRGGCEAQEGGDICIPVADANILQFKKKKAGPKATIRRVSHCNKIKHFYMFCRTLMQELQGSHL